MKVQITLFDENKIFKPLSTVLEVPNMEYAESHKKELINKAYQVIAGRKYVLSSELYSQGYTKVRMREYDIEKIKRMNMMNYILKKRQNKNP